MSRRLGRRCRGERGVALLMTAVAMIVILVLAALVVDVGRSRATARQIQTAADLAALAAGKDLGNGDATGACQHAAQYLASNLAALASLNPTTFCGNALASTVCTGGAVNQAAPTTTASGVTVTIHYPVPDSEISDGRITGARLNDSTPCKRLRIVVTDTRAGFFSSIAGKSSLTVSRSATVAAKATSGNQAPAMWLLDPTGCTSLSISGGSKVTVGTAYRRAAARRASSACTRCPPPPPAAPLRPATPPTCQQATSAHSPHTAGRSREPRSTGGTTASRPTPHSTASPSPVAPTARPAYVDLLAAAVGTTGSPGATYSRWSSTYSCNPSGTITVSGNWWVDCSTFAIGNGTNITFAGGNVVTDGNLNMTGGTLRFNTANPAGALPSSCIAPTVTTPCTASSSASAATVWGRNGAWKITGGTLTANHTAVFVKGGYFQLSGNPPVWSAPTAGPFTGLAFWDETQSNKFQINGGSGANLTGVFFLPEATPFTLAGGGSWGQQGAQFIAYQLVVTGGSTLAISPDANAITIPTASGLLIR